MKGFHGRWRAVEPWPPRWLWNLRIEFVSLAFPHILISSSSPRPLDFSTPSTCQNHGLARMTGFHGRWRTRAAGVAVELKNRIYSRLGIFSQPPAYLRGRHNLLLSSTPRLLDFLHLSESRIGTDDGIPRKMGNCRTLAAWVAVELEN